MMEVIKQQEGVFEIHVQGKIRKEDYDFIPRLESEVERYGTVNLYCEIESIDGIEPGAVWEDLKFGVNHYDSFERVAIVGNQKWVEWMTRLAKPFNKATVKVFAPEQLEEAKNWVS